MKKLISLIFIFSLICFSAMAEQVDQVNCQPVTAQQFKVLSLLSTVKNNILGTVPRFCREGGFFQLKDKVNKDEVELSKFVEELKSLNPDAEDALPFKGKISDAVIFKTVKMMVMKKMWQHSSENNQISILLSEECASLELNKIPMSKMSGAESVKEKDPEKSLLETRKICQVQRFEALAPYLTQDVIAEALLNLKTVFPKSFPKIVDSFCDKLEDTDELILKSDKYDNFASGDLSVASANEHAGWLKEVYSKVDLEQYDGNFVLNNSIMSKYQHNDAMTFSKLSSDERGIIKSYTDMSYRDINSCLRESRCDDVYLKKSAESLSLVLDKLNKNEKGVKDSKLLFRGVESLPAEISAALSSSPKNFVLDKGFMSASGDSRVAKRFAKLHRETDEAHALFIMKTKSCAGISGLSTYKEEDEFLCPSSMKFNVKIRSEDPKIYILEEVGINEK